MSEQKPGAAWASDMLAAFDTAHVVHVIAPDGSVLRDERTWQVGESVEAVQR